MKRYVLRILQKIDRNFTWQFTLLSSHNSFFFLFVWQKDGGCGAFIYHALYRDFAFMEFYELADDSES